MHPPAVPKRSMGIVVHMTLQEKGSLRSAVLIVAVLYGVIFGGLSLLTFDPSGSAKRKASAPSPPLVVELAADRTAVGVLAPGEARALQSVKSAQPRREESRVAALPPPISVGERSNTSPGGAPTPVRTGLAVSASDVTRAARTAGAIRKSPQTATAVEPHFKHAARSSAGGDGLHGRNALTTKGGAVHAPQENWRGTPGVEASAGLATGPDDHEMLTALLASIQRRIVGDRIYPAAAKRRGIQGSVTIAASVGAHGRLLTVRIVHSSGSRILDQAAETLLRGVFPVANPLLHEFTLEVPITYRLEPPE